MDTFLELQTALQSDLNANSESTLFTPTAIKLAINRAYRRAGGFFEWPETEDAQKTTTQLNQEYYDYPDNWRPDSAWKLTIDGEDYGDPLEFKDYLYEKENSIPSGADLLWANQWRRYFVYPTPTTAGLEITIWGHKIVDKLVNDADLTIFSYAMPECNDAIVLEAGAILRAKGEDKETSEFKSVEAKTILARAWDRIRKEKAKYKKTLPFFDVPDYFGKSNSSSLIGKF